MPHLHQTQLPQSALAELHASSLLRQKILGGTAHTTMKADSLTSVKPHFAAFSIRETSAALHFALLVSSAERWVHLEEHWWAPLENRSSSLPRFTAIWPSIEPLFHTCAFWTSPTPVQDRRVLGRLLLYAGEAPLSLPFRDYSDVNDEQANRPNAGDLRVELMRHSAAIRQKVETSPSS